MPDGTIHHHGLRGQRFQHLYKQVEEGIHPPEVLAHRAVRSLGGLIKNYGNAPVQFIQQIADIIESACAAPTLTPWHELRHTAEQMARTVIANDKRAVDQALKACQQQINDLEYGVVPSNLHSAMVERYILNVYVSEFESLVEVPPRGRDRATHAATVGLGLNEMRPYVQTFVIHIADQLARDNNVQHFRQPPSPNAQRPVDAEEDLLAPTY